MDATFQRIETGLDEKQLLAVKSGLDLDNPAHLSHWVKTLRANELPRSAESALVSYLTERRRASKALGWPRDDYVASGDLLDDEPELLVPREGRSLSDLTVRPDESQYLIPKFRGIHYRDEPTSRFHDTDVYEQHVESSQLREDTLSAAMYKSGDSGDETDPRPRIVFGAQMRLSDKYDLSRMNFDSLIASENRLRAKFSEPLLDPDTMQNFDELKYVKPPLARDVIDNMVVQRAKLPRPSVGGKYKQKKPSGQTNSLQYEEQMYVNRMAVYDDFQREHTGDIGAFQVSVTDNPLHGAKYAYGEKFTSSMQKRFNVFAQEKKRTASAKRTDNEALAAQFLARDNPTDAPEAVRRTHGTVGKLYTYLVPPKELYPQSVAPELTPITTMIARRKDEISLIPNQARELETTYLTQIPEQHLALEKKVEIPSADREKYGRVYFTPMGSSMRDRFAAGMVEGAWNDAHAKARALRKILIPHGTFDTIYRGGEITRTHTSIGTSPSTSQPHAGTGASERPTHVPKHSQGGNSHEGY